MATPLGHSIVGLLVARAAGVDAVAGRLFAIGAASLPDVDVFLGQLATGEAFGLHHRIVTHKPQFAVAAAVAAGLAVGLIQGRRAGLRAGAFVGALVGSHVAMDRLPLPYDTMDTHHAPFWLQVTTHGWNAVIDLALYGGMAMAMALRRRTA